MSERAPATHISLTNGAALVVTESFEQVMDLLSMSRNPDDFLVAPMVRLSGLKRGGQTEPMAINPALVAMVAADYLDNYLEDA